MRYLRVFTTPRCQDVHSTYFEGITKVDGKYTRKEIKEIEEEQVQVQKEQYAARQEKKYDRLAKYSLDEENIARYEAKRDEWQSAIEIFSRRARFKTGKSSSKKYAESKRPLANFKALPSNLVVNTLRKESDEWIKKLTDKEKHAIKKYTYNSGDKKPNRFFERLNAMLRGDISSDEKLQEYADTISSAIRKNKIAQDIIVYRNLDVDLYSDFKVNDVFEEEQFISTSVIQTAALSKKYKLIIYVPKGSNGAYIEKLSKYPKQRELLLDMKTKFIVLSKKDNVIELKVIK